MKPSSVSRERNLSPFCVVQMVAPLLRTLVKLHGMHILHRDIKPENIFLSSSQRFKLGDLGLAIQSDLELPFTRSGTLDYLSPEVLQPCHSTRSSLQIASSQQLWVHNPFESCGLWHDARAIRERWVVRHEESPTTFMPF